MSEGTVSLIRNLLVLQPTKRLMADQVLDSLATIIATLKVPVHVGDEDDQVVPDINDFNDNERNKKVEKKEETLSQLSVLTDFSKQVTIQVRKHNV